MCPLFARYLPLPAKGFRKRGSAIAGEGINEEFAVAHRVGIGGVSLSAGNGLVGQEKANRARNKSGEPMAALDGANPSALSYSRALRFGDKFKQTKRAGRLSEASRQR